MDIVSSSILIANVVHTRDFNNRITFHMNRIGCSGNFSTTVHTIVNENFIGIVRRVIIKNPGLLGEVRTRNERHQEAVLFPNITQCRVHITLTRDFVLEVSHHIDGSAFADIHVGRIITIHTVRQDNSVNNRISDNDRVRVTCSRTTGEVVRHVNGQDSLIRTDICSVDTFSTPRNHTINAICNLMPLINERPHVVVTEVSRSRNLATLANRVIIKRNSNMDGVSNIDVVRIAFSNTTILINGVSREDIRMILRFKRSLQSVITNSRHFDSLTINQIVTTLKRVVVQTPSVSVVMIVSHRISRIIDESIKGNRAVVANQRIARDLDSRISKNNQSVRLRNCIRDTTILVDGLEVIDVHTRCIRHNRKSSQMFARNFNTILVPNIVGMISRSSCHNSLSTLANRIIANNRSIRSLRQFENNNLDGVNALASTTRGGNRRGNLEGGSSIRSHVNRRSRSITSIGIPLIRNITNPTISISIQRNMLALADSRTSSGNLNINTEGVNLERSRNRSTTLLAISRHCVDTGRYPKGVSLSNGGRSRAPSILDSTNSGDRQLRGVILTNDIITRDGNQRRSSLNIHRINIGKRIGNTTVGTNGLGGKLVPTGRHRGNDQLLITFTGNLNTVHEPLVGSTIRMVRHIDGNRGVLTNRVSSSSDDRSGRERKNVDLNRVNTLASTARGGNRRGNHIRGRCSRSHIDRSSFRIIGIGIPLVGNIANPTIGVGVQRGVLTLANRCSRSCDLNISTEGVNLKRSRNRSTTLLAVSRHRVDTGRYPKGISLSNGGRSRAPSILDSTNSGNRQLRGVILTNDIVARDGNQRRSSLNIHRINIRKRIGNTTVSTDGLGGKLVPTGRHRSNDQLLVALTRNLNTVHEPLVGSTIGMVRHIDGNRGILTNRVSSSGNNRSICYRKNDDLNGVNALASTARRSNRRGNHIRGGLRRSNIHRRSCGIVGIGIPLVGNVTNPTIGVGVQRDMFSRANSRSRSRDLNISTEGVNLERSGDCGTTLLAVSRHRVNTGGYPKGVSLGNGGRSRAPSILDSTNSGNRQLRGVILTNDIVARNGNQRRSSLNIHRINIGKRIGNTTVRSDSLGGKLVPTGRHRSSNQLLISFTNEFNTIHKPFVGSTIRMVRHIDGNCGVLTNRVSYSCNNRSGRERKNVDLDGVSTLASTARRSNRRSNNIRGSLRRSNIHRRCCSIVGIGIPLIGDVTNPTIGVGVQRDMLSSANRSGRSRNLNVRTESINRKRIRNRSTTILTISRNSVNTGRNLKCAIRNLGSRSSAPSIFLSTNSKNCQHRAVVLTNNIVTCNRNKCRSSFNRDRISLRSRCGNTVVRIHSLNTIGMDTHRRHNIQNRLIFTRNLNTILIPNVSSMGCRISCNHRLGTFTNLLRSGSNRRSIRQIEDNHTDGINTLTGTICRGNRRSNRIVGSCFRSHIDRRSVVIIFTPSVSHIARPTISVNIQRDMVAFTDGRLGSINLNIGTESGNGERISNSSTIISTVSRNGVNTSRDLNSLGGSTCTPFPRIHVNTIDRQSRAIALTKNIDARNSNQCRSGLNRDILHIGSFRNTTLVAHSLHIESMGTRIVKRNIKHIQVLTLNLNAIHIPNIGSGTSSSRQCQQIASTNSSISRNFRFSRCFVNRNYNILNKITSSNVIHRSRNRISGRRSRSHIDRRSGLTALPSVSHIACPTIGIGIDCNRLALADFVSRGVNLEVSTESGNGERSGHRLTVVRSSCHRVSTSCSVD